MAITNLIGRRIITILPNKFIEKKNSITKSFLSNSYFSTTFGKRYSGRSFEPDGKTIAFVLNKRNSNLLTISEIKNFGFVLSSEAEIVGATIFFPHTIISWNVTSAEDVNEDSLTLFKVLEPKLDILIFGFGEPKDYTPKVRQNFTQICKRLGLRFEALPTEQAAGLFNFISYDGRFAAAALIPPRNLDVSKFRRKKHEYRHLGFEENEEEDDLKIEKSVNRRLLT